MPERLKTLPLSNILNRRLRSIIRKISGLVTAGQGTPDAIITAVNQTACKEFSQLLSEFLPPNLVVQTAKIVDEHRTVSDEFGVVVSKRPTIDLGWFDNYVPLVPYEMVYAIGDIRAVAAPQYIEEFCGKLAKLQDSLRRNDTSATLMQATGPLHLTSADDPPEHHVRNTLFSFFLSVASEPFGLPDFEEEADCPDSVFALRSFYSSRSARYLPTTLVLLNAFGIFPTQLNRLENGVDISYFTTPEHLIDPNDGDSSFRHYWVLAAPSEQRSVTNFAMFVTLLAEHIRTTVLSPMDLENYLRLDELIEGLHLLGPIE